MQSLRNSSSFRTKERKEKVIAVFIIRISNYYYYY